MVSWLCSGSRADQFIACASGHCRQLIGRLNDGHGQRKQAASRSQDASCARWIEHELSFCCVEKGSILREEVAGPSAIALR